MRKKVLLSLAASLLAITPSFANQTEDSNVNLETKVEKKEPTRLKALSPSDALALLEEMIDNSPASDAEKEELRRQAKEYIVEGYKAKKRLEEITNSKYIAAGIALTLGGETPILKIPFIPHSHFSLIADVGFFGYLNVDGTKESLVSYDGSGFYSGALDHIFKRNRSVESDRDVALGRGSVKIIVSALQSPTLEGITGVYGRLLNFKLDKRNSKSSMEVGVYADPISKKTGYIEITGIRGSLGDTFSLSAGVAYIGFDPITLVNKVTSYFVEK